MGWVYGHGYRGPVDTEALSVLTRRLRRTRGERLVMSNEDLAEAPPEAIEAFRDAVAAADLDLEVIVTTRHWSRQLPSEWQQFLKVRLTKDFAAFVADVRAREGDFAERFWRRQYLPEICGRWSAGADPASVHVLVVPGPSGDRGAVLRYFCETVGIDPATLVPGHDNVNRSYGHREAEILRRINLRLEERLPDYRDYRRAVRAVLSRRVLARGASSPVRLPSSETDWVGGLMAEQVAQVTAAGYRVRGDLDALLVADPAPARLDQATEEELAAAAVDTLVEFALLRLADRHPDDEASPDVADDAGPEDDR